MTPEERAEWDLYDDMGRAASEKARRALIAAGIGYVFGRDGAVIERLPDGSERILKPTTMQSIIDLVPEEKLSGEAGL